MKVLSVFFSSLFFPPPEKSPSGVFLIVSLEIPITWSGAERPSEVSLWPRICLTQDGC